LKRSSSRNVVEGAVCGELFPQVSGQVGSLFISIMNAPDAA
jgi:hypothetical protein